MISEDFDPMRDLDELKKFAHAADTHIISLHNNQLVFVEQINELRKDMMQLTTVLNKILKEIEDETH
jgi:3-dehydroquinate dehydratase